MSLSITLSAEPREDWAPLARDHGLFYHHPLWIRTLGRTYSYQLHCLTALREGRVVGCLALAAVPALIGRGRLVSLPFSYAAGPLAEDPETYELLVTSAQSLARDRGVARLEVKQRAPASDEPVRGMVRIKHYSSYVLDTRGGESKVWEQLHASSTRRGIKKAEKEGVTVRRGTSREDWLAMAALEEATAHRHGVPSPPRRFFTEACLTLQQSGLADVYLASLKNGGLAAGIVVWKGSREWIYAYGASRPEALGSRPNHLLLWTAVQGAIAANVGFDFGRAAPEQEGLVEFKRRWGGQPMVLSYDYWPAPGGLNVASRSRGPLALAARVWSHLPARLTRAGSFLYRYLG